MAGQVAVMGTALAGTGCSTLLLNLCVSPYVFRMIEVNFIAFATVHTTCSCLNISLSTKYFMAEAIFTMHRQVHT